MVSSSVVRERRPVGFDHHVWSCCVVLRRAALVVAHKADRKNKCVGVLNNGEGRSQRARDQPKGGLRFCCFIVVSNCLDLNELIHHVARAAARRCGVSRTSAGGVTHNRAWGRVCVRLRRGKKILSPLVFIQVCFRDSSRCCHHVAPCVFVAVSGRCGPPSSSSSLHSQNLEPM